MKWPWENESQETIVHPFNDSQIGEYDDQYVLLQRINKIYGKKFHAVHDFSLCIKKKEFVVFVGPSGCGKSTTLRMIAGLEDISSGNLFIDGEYANNLLAKERDIAMVFQNYALYPNMSVFDNMAFALKVRKHFFPVYELTSTNEFRNEVQNIRAKYKEERSNDISEFRSRGASKEEIKDYLYLSRLSEVISIKEIREKYQTQVFTYNHDKASELKRIINVNKDPTKQEELNAQLQEVLSAFDTPVYKYRHCTKEEIVDKVCNAAHILEILDQLKKKPKELSGGQRQRVALGRAIVRNAKIFLMDEPLSNLDAKLRVQMRSEIIELHKKINATTIYVTHDQTEAMTMADRIVVMKDGYIQQIGTPMEIYQNPRNLFVASFIGSPAMNLLDGTYDNGTIVFQNSYSYKLNKELIRKHDAYFAKLYADETRKYPDFVEQLNQEKTDFDSRKHSIKDIEEFNEKYNKLLSEKDAFISKLDAIIHGGAHEVVFGIRPESIIETDEGNSLSIKVRLSELLGDQYFVHFDFGGKDFLSKVSAEKSIESGTDMKLKIIEEKIHIFDKDSGMTIF